MGDFKTTKAELRSRTAERCRELLLATEGEKAELLCPLCDSSCDKPRRIYQALRWLLEHLAVEAAKETKRHTSADDVEYTALFWGCLFAATDATHALVGDLLHRNRRPGAALARVHLQEWRAAQRRMVKALLRIPWKAPPANSHTVG